MEPTAEVLTRLEPLLRPLGPALYELRSPVPPGHARARPDRRRRGAAAADAARPQPDQLVNVTTLPGIKGVAIGMPDMHEGYGFPVGGVAGTVLPTASISPGGIGFDINCGVRLLATGLSMRGEASVEPWCTSLAASIPTASGAAAGWRFEREQLERVLAEGVPYVVRVLGLAAARGSRRASSRAGALAGADADRGGGPGQASAAGTSSGRWAAATTSSRSRSSSAVYDAGPPRRSGCRGPGHGLIHTGSRGLGPPGLHATTCARWTGDGPKTASAARPAARLRAVASPRGAGATRGACAPRPTSPGATARCSPTGSARSSAGSWAARGEALASLVYDVAHNIAKLEEHRTAAKQALRPPQGGDARVPPGTPGAARRVPRRSASR